MRWRQAWNFWSSLCVIELARLLETMAMAPRSGATGATRRIFRLSLPQLCRAGIAAINGVACGASPF